MNIQSLNNIVWNIPNGVKANCYLFALAPTIGKGGYADRPFKSQPGYKCESYRNKKLDFSSCKDIQDRIKCDNPLHIEKIQQMQRHDNFSHYNHVICVLITQNSLEYRDFHFIRRIPFKSFLQSIEKFKIKMPLKTRIQLDILLQNPPKYIWAHQRGWSHVGPIIHDANEDIILDPLKANFNYERLNYNKICGFFKVRTRMATVFNNYNTETLRKKTTYENKHYAIDVENTIKKYKK